MSGHSIEHSLVFNTAKRVLRFVAPEFRVIARSDIPGNVSRLDLRLKILEVPEGQAFRAAGMIVFNAGLLRLKDDPRFKSVFGRIDASLPDAKVIEKTAREHAEADEEAYRWALGAMATYFPEIEETRVRNLVDHRFSYENWVTYFST